MNAPTPIWRGRPDETGFLLLPLAALVFSSAVLLAVVFGLTVLARPGCGLGDVLDHPCSEMFVRMSNFFNLLAVPGVVLFAWQTRRQRHHTRPLEPGMFRAAEEVIAEVLASVTLRRPTPVLLGTRLGRRAFTGGTGDKPYVALGPELLATAAKGPEGRAVFEAVLRHELAHVQNHDLLRLRFATVLRISTRATALGTGLLLLAQLIWPPEPPTAGETLGVLVRATVLAVLAELTTRAFLRLREQQADVRAAGGDPDGIRVALPQGPEASRGLPGRLWQRLWDRHPSVATRLAALADPTAALTFPLGQLFAGGVFTAVALTNAQLLVELMVADEVLAVPAGEEVLWGGLAVLTLAAIQPVIFLADGVWRDVRGRQLAGRPERPAALGAVFAAGLLAGTHLAPYTGLVHQPRPDGWPLLPSLVVLAAAAVLLCRWLTGLVRRAAPTTSVGRRVLLLPALPVGVGVLLLAWETLLWVSGWAYECDHYPVECGPLDTGRLALRVAGTPWAVGVLSLATLALLVVTPRRSTRGALVTAAGAALSGALLVLALPRLEVADAVALDVWTTLDPRLGTPVAALALQVTLLVAVPLAVLLPRASAGPLAAGAGWLVLAAGLDAQLAEWAEGPVAARPEDLTYAVGTFLGQALAVVLLAVAAALAARTLIGRRLARRPIDTPRPPQRKRTYQLADDVG
ncbi:M48 family metalloprotease [Micromonospora purpureochromogenes]|uniref:M48 family metalloprotease n=1 Tax=Micromonospora purpureochromogenes TaxID=47872 RepID=UPI0033FD27F4